jgi:putative ABC transport system permease protein
MVAMATMVDSFRSSFDAWLARVLSADLYVRAAPAGTTGQFSAADLERMGADPDVERAEFSRTVPLVLDPARPPVNLIARPLERAHAQSSLPLIGTEYSVAAADLPVWVSEPMAELYAAHPGAILELPLGERRVKVTVAGVWRDYARQGGSVAIDLADYERLSGDMARTDAALWLRPGGANRPTRANPPDQPAPL